MDLVKFKKRLKEIGITKKELAQKLKLSYTTVNAWGSTQDFPNYIEIVLDNWVKANNFDKIINMLKDFEEN